MKKEITVNGCPGFEGRNGNDNEHLVAPYPQFAEGLRRRANYRLRESREYQRAIADCMAAHKARQRPSPSTGWAVEVDLRRVALILTGLIIISVILGVGCKVVKALPSVMSEHTGAIAAEMAD